MDTNCILVFGCSLGNVALGQKYVAEIVARLNMVGVDAYFMFKFAPGTVKVSLTCEYDAEVGTNVEVIRVDTNRVFVFSLGLLHLAFFIQYKAEVEVGSFAFRPILNIVGPKSIRTLVGLVSLVRQITQCRHDSQNQTSSDNLSRVFALLAAPRLM